MVHYKSEMLSGRDFPPSLLSVNAPQLTSRKAHPSSQWLLPHVTGAIVALAYVLADYITGAFLTEQAVADLATHLLHIVLWTIVLFGCSSVFMSVMRASGAIYAPTVLGMSTILLVEIPAAYIFNNWIGIDGIWWAYALTFCIMLCMQSGYYTFIFSKRKIVKMI